jgi:hypothetical protein
MFGDALGTAHVLLPQVSQEVNQMMAALQKAVRKGLSTLVSGPSGGEFRNTLRVLGDTFSKSIGPGIHGVSNMILVLGRIIRAAAPWVVRLSKAWASFTDRLVARTSNQKKVEGFINRAVNSFKLWWGLLKAIGGVLRTVFGSSKDEGDKVVVVLTKGVNALNDWLKALRDRGSIQRFWDTWNSSVSVMWNALKNALQHPETILPNILRAIDVIAPIIMNHLSMAIVKTAPVAADHFVRAFLNAGAWAKFFVVAYFLKKFGVFRILGRLVATIFVEPFLAAFMARFAAGIGIASAEGGAIAAAAGAAGGAAGTAFGVAFRFAALAAITYGLYKGLQALNKEAEKQKKLRAPLEHQRQQAGITPYRASRGGPTQVRGQNLPHHQVGGTIPPGGLAVVGEAGPELASVSGAGTQITPIRGMNPITSMPHIAGEFNVTVHSSIVVDRREIARAVDTERAYVRARRR